MLCLPNLKPTQRLHQNYLQNELPKLNASEKITTPHEITALQNRACSSLCELSANICKDQATERPLLQVQRNNCNFSPWTLKKKQQLDENLVKKRKKNLNKQTIKTLAPSQEQDKRFIQNKENIEFDKKIEHQSLEMKKKKSIFFRIVGLREGKGTLNLKSEHPDIEMIACLQKKKYSHLEISKSNNKKSTSINEVGVQVNRQINPNSLQLQHNKKQQLLQNSAKKLQNNLLSNWSQETKEEKDLFNEHWKGKTKNLRNKKHKKTIVARNSKSIQARQIKETLFVRRKGGSVSLDRTRKDQYKSNNPLTRLLYQKYLHTIGLCQGRKQPLSNFL